MKTKTPHKPKVIRFADGSLSIDGFISQGHRITAPVPAREVFMPIPMLRCSPAEIPTESLRSDLTSLTFLADISPCEKP